jgi:hypothetical protein
MKKLALNIEDLEVETFSTGSDGTQRGTVQAKSWTDWAYPSCGDYSNCGEYCAYTPQSCQYSCNGSCQYSCDGTCYEGTCVGDTCPQGCTVYDPSCGGTCVPWGICVPF